MSSPCPCACSVSSPFHALPQMVTKYKLGYDPVEVDPEDMVRGSLVAVARGCVHGPGAGAVGDW